jgi:hypothetical protein
LIAIKLKKALVVLDPNDVPHCIESGDPKSVKVDINYENAKSVIAPVLLTNLQWGCCIANIEELENRNAHSLHYSYYESIKSTDEGCREEFMNYVIKVL